MNEIVERVEDRLADFTRDKRVIVLSWMALIVGALSALVAYALVWLIASITNLAFYQHFSPVFQSPDQHHPGLLCHFRSSDRRADYRLYGSLRFRKNSRTRYSGSS